MMAEMTKLSTILLVSLLTATCGSREQSEKVKRSPDFWWQGDLVELDGTPLSSSIKIEIKSADRADKMGPIQYNLESGCTGVGHVEISGVVRASEVLRPCEEADVGRMRRLTAISGPAEGVTGPGKATLVWNDREATLASPSGIARFRNSEGR